MRVEQQWQEYRPADHLTWATLYRRRMPELERTASRVFLGGARAIGLDPERIPRLDLMNHRLRRRTGWSAVPVGGFLPAEEFFASLARRRFPTTVTIRAPDSLEYTPAPDIFHDVFGHVPMHADPVFAAFLQRFGALAADPPEGVTTEQLARLFWFTVEFGLVREGGAIRLYGSGLISSSAEAAHALGPDCEQRPFDLEEVLHQPFEIDRLQPVLYVVESFAWLFEAVRRLAGVTAGSPPPPFRTTAP